MTRPIYRPPWRIDLDVRDGVRSPLGGATLGRVVAAALEAAGAPAPASIGLILADDAELARLNATHMGVDGPTDVLSFPLVPPEVVPVRIRAGRRRRAPERRSSPCRRAAGCISATSSCPWSGPSNKPQSGRGGHTGDVRWSAADELRLLVTHGVLHVCGWDHAEPDEEAAMRALERRLLNPTVKPLPVADRPRG